jgi:hypothetical protein
VGVGGKCGPNALKSTHAGAVARSFTCDANGNQLGQVASGGELLSRAVVYDADNLPTSISHVDTTNPSMVDGSVKFDYGPDGNRYESPRVS